MRLYVPPPTRVRVLAPTPLARRLDAALGSWFGSKARLPALAAAAGCTLADLDAWRKGAAAPDQGQLSRLADALRLSFLWLVYGHRGLPIRATRRLPIGEE